MVLEFSSRVVYTKNSNFRIRVDAHHINHETGERDHTNVFHYHVRIRFLVDVCDAFAARWLMLAADVWLIGCFQFRHPGARHLPLDTTDSAVAVPMVRDRSATLVLTLTYMLIRLSVMLHARRN